MKGRVRVNFSFEFRADQLLKAQFLHQHFENVISSNFGAKMGDKQCFRPFRFLMTGSDRELLTMMQGSL
jgi:hypothetical protein